MVTSPPLLKSSTLKYTVCGRLYCARVVTAYKTSSYRLHILKWNGNRFVKNATAGWINRPMALGTEVGLGPGHIVLDGDPPPPPKGGGAQPPIFGPCLLWPNGRMHQDTTWYGSRPQPRRHCFRRGPIPSSAKGAQQPPSFRPISIVATVAHLSYC